MTEAEAMEEIKDVVPVDNEPEISDAELKRILRRRARASVRVQNFAYNAGDRIVFEPSNGRIFECIVSGTTADDAFSVGFVTRSGVAIVDGTATFRDVGPAHPDNYDITGSIGDAWRLKAAKDSALIDMSDKDTKMQITARRDFAQATAARYPGIWLK